MNGDYLPKADAAFLAWSANASTLFQAWTTTCGLTEDQATDYKDAQLLYAQKLTIATEPTTRTKPTIREKDEAKASLVALSRRFVKIVQVCATTTNPMRDQLGITVPKTTRTRVNPADIAPMGEVVGTYGGSTVQARFFYAVGSRSKYPTSAAIGVFTFVGEYPPTDLTEWKLALVSTNPGVSVDVGDTAPSHTVWITAAWMSPTAEFGPAMAPLRVSMPAGNVLPTMTAMKVAA